MFKSSVPVFDCNVSLGRSHNRRVAYDRTEDLLRVMAGASISRALVYNPLSIYSGTDEGNEALLKALRDEKSLVPQLVVSLATDDIVQVQTLTRRAQVRSLRVFPNSHRYPLVNWVADAWLDWMEQERLALWVPFGLRPEVDVRDLYQTAKAHPGVPVVLAGTHYSNYATIWPLMRALDHVYLDLSRFDLADGVKRLIDHVGVSRLLYGSDYPEVDPEPYLFYLHNCGLTTSELQAICHDNLSTLLFGKD